MSTSAERHEQWRSRTDQCDKNRVRAEWLSHLSSKRLFRTEFRILWPDNTWKWIRSQAFPSLDEHGDVQRWFGVMADISAERALAGRIAELESRIAQLQSTHESPAELTVAARNTAQSAPEPS